MSKNDKNIVKSETELKKLIEDTRKLRNAVKPVYNPTIYLLINGMEVANFQESGFPKYVDIKKLVEASVTKYKPLEIIVDSSLRYLLDEAEQAEYETALQNGLVFRNIHVPFVEVASYEDCIVTLLKHALKNNAKVLSNQNLLETYEIIKQQKAKNFENKKFQVYYKITKDEIAIFE